MSSLRTNVTHVAAGAGPELNDRSTADCSSSWLAEIDPEPSIAPAGSTPEGGHREMRIVAAAIRDRT
jgi:hypothetical protein